LRLRKVHHHHVVLLPVAMAAADALLDALRVPGQVVVHYQRAELEVDAFGARLGGDHDAALLAEVIHERRAHVGGARTGDPVAALMAFQPLVVDQFGAVVGVRAVEQDDALSKRAVRQHAKQVALGAARFGEDDGLLLGADFLGLGEGDGQRLQQRLALGIVLNGGCQLGEGVEVGDFLLKCPAVVFGKEFNGFVVGPFLGGFVEGFVVLIQLVFERFGRLLLAQLDFEPVGNRGQRAGNGKRG
jgi:hypothetical protein